MEYSNIFSIYNVEYDLVLCHRDTELVKFKASSSSGLDYVYTIYFVNEHAKELLPFMYCDDITVMNTSLKRWITLRPISTNREHISNVLESLGLEGVDPLKMLLVNYACSLNDCYWIKDITCNLNFSDVNLYHNKFDEALGYITFFGHKSSLGGNLVTPEITTQGVLGKQWIQEDGQTNLYKKGSSGGANTGREPVTEYIASLIAEEIGLPHIQYELVKYKGVLCTKCKCFTSYDVGFISMEQLLYRQGYVDIRILGLSDILKIVSDINNDYADNLIDIFIFDYIIENRDRHINNYGFLIDNSTNNIISLAPIFDNGLSLHYSCMSGDYCLSNPETYTETSPTGLTNMFIASRLIEKRHVDMVMLLDKALHYDAFKDKVYNALSMYYTNDNDLVSHYVAIIKLLHHRISSIKTMYKMKVSNGNS